jgi:hypothetical protein
VLDLLGEMNLPRVSGSSVAQRFIVRPQAAARAS